MGSGAHLHTIGDRIEKLGTALFSDLGNSILKLPTSVVNIMCVYRETEIWFAVSRPFTDISGMDKKFPAAMHFYNRRFNYHIHVDGIGFIISDLNEMPSKVTQNIFKSEEGKIIVCVRMERYDYFIRKINENEGFYQVALNSMKELLFHNETSYFI